MSVQHLDTDPCTTVRLPHRAGTSERARVMMRDELVAAGLRPAVVNDAQIVLGELVMNAVEHGRPDADGTVEVSWCVHDDHLRISVLDGGSVPELKALPFTDDSLRGRGLAMVDYLCERWVHDDEHGTRVTAELSYGR
jgi:serine/threonine-protein kinase RsbW